MKKKTENTKAAKKIVLKKGSKNKTAGKNSENVLTVDVSKIRKSVSKVTTQKASKRKTADSPQIKRLESIIKKLKLELVQSLRRVSKACADNTELRERLARMHDLEESIRDDLRIANAEIEELHEKNARETTIYIEEASMLRSRLSVLIKRADDDEELIKSLCKRIVES